MNFPGRILFDTNVVNFTLDWAEVIFDEGDLPSHIHHRDKSDVLALRSIFMTGQRASWQLAISPLTYREIMATPNPDRRASLEKWFGELWQYWREFFEQENLSDECADSLARNLEPSKFLLAIPQISDKKLIAHAISYGCDGFCTRDRKTILRHREKLRGVPLCFISPAEWRNLVRRYEAIWA